MLLYGPIPHDEGSREAPTTTENVIRCLCCTTCPTLKHTGCSGWAHCATGKIKKPPEMMGCDCPKCPAYVQYALTRCYYCIHGVADSRPKGRRLRAIRPGGCLKTGPFVEGRYFECCLRQHPNANRQPCPGHFASKHSSSSSGS